jgi:hypothetical protein
MKLTQILLESEDNIQKIQQELDTSYSNYNPKVSSTLTGVKIEFVQRKDIPEQDWNNLINFSKGLGYRIGSEERYFENEPGEKLLFPRLILVK